VIPERTKLGRPSIMPGPWTERRFQVFPDERYQSGSPEGCSLLVRRR